MLIYVINSFFFDETLHQYTYNDEIFDSVTTIIHNCFKPFDADKVITNLMNSKFWKNNKLYGKTREEIKEFWNKSSEIAMKEGVKLHNDIENYFNFIAVDNVSEEYQFFLNWWKKKQNKSNTYTEIPYRTEWKIYHEELKLAGTIDFVTLPFSSSSSDSNKKENKDVILYDWKRSKKIRMPSKSNKKDSSCVIPGLEHLEDVNYIQYSLQLNIYKYILEQKYGKTVKGLFLIIFHPDNLNYIVYEALHLHKEVELLMKNRLDELYFT